MTQPVAISPTDEARLDDLYTQLKHARTDLRMVTRGYRNAVLAGDNRMAADFRQRHAEVAAHYNQLVGEINALTAPHRADRRAANKAAAVARHEAAEAQRRAQLRATACTVCGLNHPGEC